MGYSKYKKIRQVKDALNCGFTSHALFDLETQKTIEPSEWLQTSLRYAYATPPTNEKSKSERLVSPVLLEVLNGYKDLISFFSGEEINIDSKRNLAGPCDFFFALGPPSPLLEAPIISVAEAKDEDLEWGIAQCAAQMFAANLFNQKYGKDLSYLYGCATTGTEWHFMRLDTKNNLFEIDIKPVSHLPMVIGIWHEIIKKYI